MQAAPSIEDILSVTTGEFYHGTGRFLPDVDTIPKVTSSDPYLKMVEAIYYGEEVPEMQVEMNPGYPEEDHMLEAMERFIQANLRSLEIDAEVRILGTTYLLKQLITLSPLEPA